MAAQPTGRPSIYQSKFDDVLQQPVIDLDKLRDVCKLGCPDGSGIRQVCWKIFLNYLPLERENWEQTLKTRREFYQQLITETIVNPHASEGGDNGHTLMDHPLNPNPTSAWSRFFKDNEQLLQIDHDCRRLYPEISFFQQASKYPCQAYKSASKTKFATLKERVEKSALPSQQLCTSRGGTRNIVSLVKSSDTAPYVSLKEGEEAHWEVCERILFVYSKINKGIQYVQGMNELVGPLYYIFASDPDPVNQEGAEADTFFCFAALMGEVSDSFNQTLDKSELGIDGQMRKLEGVLQKIDKDIYDRFVHQKLNPQFYAFRWKTLLLSQEFLLPDVIELWDCLFADKERFNFIYYICCQMLILCKDRLLAGKFEQNIQLLQNYPRDVSIQRLIKEAYELQEKFPM